MDFQIPLSVILTNLNVLAHMSFQLLLCYDALVSIKILTIEIF